MIEIDMVGLGERVATYRKMNGHSAQKLADAAGLTRAVVVNIESGRKADVGISDLLAIAWALGVTPVALLFDLKKPRAPIGTMSGVVEVQDVVSWVQGPVALGLAQPGPTPASRQVVQILGSLSLWYSARGRLTELEKAADRQGLPEQGWALEERQRLLEQIRFAEGHLSEHGVIVERG